MVQGAIELYRGQLQDSSCSIWGRCLCLIRLLENNAEERGLIMGCWKDGTKHLCPEPEDRSSCCCRRASPTLPQILFHFYCIKKKHSLNTHFRNDFFFSSKLVTPFTNWFCTMRGFKNNSAFLIQIFSFLLCAEKTCPGTIVIFWSLSPSSCRICYLPNSLTLKNLLQNQIIRNKSKVFLLWNFPFLFVSHSLSSVRYELSLSLSSLPTSPSHFLSLLSFLSVRIWWNMSAQS